MEILRLTKSPQGAYEEGVFDLDLGPKWGVIHKNLKICKSKSGHFYVRPNNYKTYQGKWEPDMEFYGENGGPFKRALMDQLLPKIVHWEAAPATYTDGNIDF